MIHYSRDFVEKVKRALPTNARLHVALDSGSPIVGDLLINEAQTIDDLHRLWVGEMKLKSDDQQYEQPEPVRYARTARDRLREDL